LTPQHLIVYKQMSTHPSHKESVEMFIYSFLITIFITPTLMADCLTCTHVQTEHGPNGESRDIYTKKCLAKQKDIENDTCEYCHCPKQNHSINRHPYKFYNGKKIAIQSLEEAHKARREHCIPQYSLVSKNKICSL